MNENSLDYRDNLLNQLLSNLIIIQSNDYSGMQIGN